MSESSNETTYGSFLRKVAAVQGVTTVSLSATIYALQKSPTLSKQLVYMNWFRLPKIDFTKPKERQSMGLFTGVPRTRYIPVMSDTGDTVPCWLTTPEEEEDMSGCNSPTIDDEQAMEALSQQQQVAEDKKEDAMLAGIPLSHMHSPLLSPVLSPVDTQPSLSPALSQRETPCTCCINEQPPSQTLFSKDEKPIYIYYHGNCSHRGEPHRVMQYKHLSKKKYKLKGIQTHVDTLLRKYRVDHASGLHTVMDMSSASYDEDMNDGNTTTTSEILSNSNSNTTNINNVTTMTSMEHTIVNTPSNPNSCLYFPFPAPNNPALPTSYMHTPHSQDEEHATVEWLIGGTPNRPSWLHRLVLPITKVRDTAYKFLSWQNSSESPNAQTLNDLAGPNGYVVSMDYRGFGDHVVHQKPRLNAWAETYKNQLSLCRWCKGVTAHNHRRRGTTIAAKQDPDLSPSSLGQHDDALAVYDWLLQDCRVDPKRVFILGHSLGTAVTASVMSTLVARELQTVKAKYGMMEEQIHEQQERLLDIQASDKTKVVMDTLYRSLCILQKQPLSLCQLPAGVVLEAALTSVFDVVLEKPPFSLLTPTEQQEQASTSMRVRREYVQTYRNNQLSQLQMLQVDYQRVEEQQAGTTKQALLGVLREAQQVHKFDALENWVDVTFSSVQIEMYNTMIKAMKSRLFILTTMLMPMVPGFAQHTVGIECTTTLHKLASLQSLREAVNFNFQYPSLQDTNTEYHALLELLEEYAGEAEQEQEDEEQELYKEQARLHKLVSVYEGSTSTTIDSIRHHNSTHTSTNAMPSILLNNSYNGMKPFYSTPNTPSFSRLPSLSSFDKEPCFQFPNVPCTGMFPLLLLHGKLDYVVQAAHTQRVYRLLSQARAHTRHCRGLLQQYLQRSQEQLRLVQDASFDQSITKISLPSIDKTQNDVINHGICLYPTTTQYVYTDQFDGMDEKDAHWTEEMSSYTLGNTHANMYACGAEIGKKKEITANVLDKPYTLILPPTGSTTFTEADSLVMQIVEEAHHDNLITFDATKVQLSAFFHAHVYRSK